MPTYLHFLDLDSIQGFVSVVETLNHRRCPVVRGPDARFDGMLGDTLGYLAAPPST